MDKNRLHLPNNLRHAAAIGVAMAGLSMGGSASAEDPALEVVAPSAVVQQYEQSKNSTLEHSCFQERLQGSAASAVAESTIFIRDFDAAGSGPANAIGSGTVIANSAVDGHHNRILTANHVVHPKEWGEFDGFDPEIRDKIVMNKRVEIFDSHKRPIGLAHIAYEPDQQDYAVLEMDKFYDGGKDLYEKIPGVHLAPRMPTSVLTGVIHSPGSPEPGNSGGPILNDQGEIEGILTRVSNTNSVFAPNPVPLEGENFGGLYGPGTYKGANKIYADQISIGINSSTIPESGRIYSTAIPQEALNALGEEGQKSHPDPSISTDTMANSHHAIITGFPYGKCQVFSGTLRPENLDDATQMTHEDKEPMLAASPWNNQKWADKKIASTLKNVLQNLPKDDPDRMYALNYATYTQTKGVLYANPNDLLTIQDFLHKVEPKMPAKIRPQVSDASEHLLYAKTQALRNIQKQLNMQNVAENN